MSRSLGRASRDKPTPPDWDEPFDPARGTACLMNGSSTAVGMPFGVEVSDAALVVSARAGEGWAMEALFNRYAPMVNGLGYRLMGRDSDLDDLVQESFVQALGSLPRLNAPDKFASWLAAIVVRTACKVLRRRYLLSRLGLRTRKPIDSEALVSSGAPPDIAAELRGVYRMLERLPPRIRLPLVLRRVEGLSLPEISELTGSSLATVKRRLAEGERLLSEALQRTEQADGQGATGEG